MDKRLEMLSDKVRMGVPIDFNEALEVIAYQAELRKLRKEYNNTTIIGKLMQWFRKI